MKKEYEHPEVTIRPMTIEDLAPIFHLGERLFTARKTPNMYRTWDEYEVVDFFMTDAEYCLVAECEGRIVGFVLNTLISKRRSAWKYGYIVWFGIEPEFKRKGIGTKLFRQVLSMMRKESVRMLLVDTEVDNDEGLKFFTGLGFENPQQHIYLTLNLTR